MLKVRVPKSKVSTKNGRVQQIAVTLILSSALVLLAGCGGNSSRGSEGGDASAPATQRALPTMPSAQFAAPTTMIRAQNGETISATTTLTATESVTDGVTGSEEVTGTEEVTATEELTATEEVTPTEEMTDSE